MNKIIKSKDRVKNLAEVFTPSKLTNLLIDCVDDYYQNNIFATTLDPSCGNGNILLEVFKRKLTYTNDVLGVINSIYGIDIMQDNITECHERLLEYAIEHKFLNEENDIKTFKDIMFKNIKQGNTLEIDFETFFD